jgi:AcrR family transcriptional regulator
VAKPLLSAEEIYDGALAVLEQEGAGALNTRCLAAHLHCSLKTLYQQVGNREAMIRGLIAHAFRRMGLEFEPAPEAAQGIRNWAMTLRAALLAHPALASLMTVDDRDAIIEYALQLIETLGRHGLSEGEAATVAGIVNHMTLSMTLSDIRAPGECGQPEVFDTALRWLIQGIQHDHPHIH